MARLQPGGFGQPIRRPAPRVAGGNHRLPYLVRLEHDLSYSFFLNPPPRAGGGRKLKESVTTLIESGETDFIAHYLLPLDNLPYKSGIPLLLVRRVAVLGCNLPDVGGTPVKRLDDTARSNRPRRVPVDGKRP